MAISRELSTLIKRKRERRRLQRLIDSTKIRAELCHPGQEHPCHRVVWADVSDFGSVTIKITSRTTELGDMKLWEWEIIAMRDFLNRLYPPPEFATAKRAMRGRAQRGAKP